MPYADISPILTMPTTVVVGWPAPVRIVFNKADGAIFDTLSVSLTGNGVEAVSITRSMEELRAAGGGLEMTLNLTATDAGECPLRFRLSIKGGPPAAGADPATKPEEWILEYSKATITILAGTAEGRSESAVIADLGAMPEFMAIGEYSRLNVALAYIWKELTFPILLPHFRSVIPPKRAPVLPERKELQPHEPRETISGWLKKSLPEPACSEFLEGTDGAKLPVAPVASDLVFSSEQDVEPAQLDWVRPAPPPKAPQSLRNRPSAKRSVSSEAGGLDWEDLKRYGWPIGVIVILLATWGIWFAIPRRQPSLPNPPPAKPTPTPPPKIPDSPQPEPVSTPVSSSPIAEAQDYIRRGKFLTIDAEKRRAEQETLKLAAPKDRELRREFLDVVNQRDTLRSAVVSGEVETAIYLARQLQERMASLYKGRPDWRAGSAAEMRLFQQNLNGVLADAFSANARNFVHNLQPKIPNPARPALAALQQVNLLFENGAALDPQCRKAWADGILAALADGTAANTTALETKLKSLLKAIPTEFEEAHTGVQRILRVLEKEENGNFASACRAEILRAIGDDLFAPGRDRKLPADERLRALNVILQEMPEAARWRERFERVIFCQTKMEEQSFVEAKSNYDDLQDSRPEKKAPQDEVENALLRNLQERLDRELQQALGPIIAKLGFPKEEEVFPAVPTSERKAELKKLQLVLESWAKTEDCPIKLGPDWKADGNYRAATENAILSAQKLCFPETPSLWTGKVSADFFSELTRRSPSQ